MFALATLGTILKAANGADDFVVEVWDTDSGLPHSTVTSIAQTPDGYLWVGTLHGGLARFDGTRFVNFDPGNTPELKSIEIHKLLRATDGTLWTGNVEGGLISYRDGKFRFEYGNNDTPRSWVEDILSCRLGQTDFSTRPGMIFRRTEAGGTNRWQVLAPPNANPTAMVCEDDHGVIWYRQANGGLAQLRGTNAVTVSTGGAASINALVKNAQGQIWVGTDDGLAEWTGTNFANKTPAAAAAAVKSILPCPDGGFWVTTPHELRRFANGKWEVALALTLTNANSSALTDSTMKFVDSRGGVWLWQSQKKLIYVSARGEITWLGAAEGKIFGNPLCWYEDSEGNIWLGLNEGGLVRIRPRIFHAVWPNGKADSKAARSVCQDARGTMWFGTGEQQVWSWEDGVFSNYDQPASHSFEDIKVAPDGSLGLWVGSVRNGLLHLRDGTFSRPFDPQKIGTVVRCLLRDRQGALWIGSEFGLFRFDTNNSLKAFTRADGFPPAYVTSLAEDSHGVIWAGTALGELRQFTGASFKIFRPADSLTDAATLHAAAASDPLSERSRGALSGGERFWAMHSDQDGTLWIGTLGGGLLRFKDEKFFRFTLRDGLPSEHISQILEDDGDQLWLGTRAGIARVSRRQLNAYADGGGPTPTFITYGKSDGLPALECSGGSQPACWRSYDGSLWFTTVRGAVWVNPANLRANRLPPPVCLETVRVDGESILKNNSGGLLPPRLLVNAGQHYFEFNFCGLSFTAPERVKFRWRLGNLEKNWVEGGSRRSATYSFLPPGSYRFEVTACNSDGVWNEQPATIELMVLPYFWQRLWFKIAMILLAFGIAVGIYTVRVSRVRALERLRLRIARDLHDEVGANLGSINLLAQMMEQSPSSSDATQVRGIAVQTIDTLRDIIWFIDPQHDKLSDLVHRLEETARVMLGAVQYRFEQSGDFQSANLSLAFRRNVPPLFKETLHNILKHSHATEVSIFVGRKAEQFQFSVRDNGIGFDPLQKNSGNGLRNLRKRSAEIGGSMEIQSSPGGGTVINFTAPVSQARDWFRQTG